MTDTLTLWDATTQTAVTSVELGAVIAGSSGDSAFRVKNLSGFYTARGITISLYGTDAYQFYLSIDGRLFGASVDLGDLPPSALSAAVTLRRVTPSDADMGSHTCNLRVSATAWT